MNFQSKYRNITYMVRRSNKKFYPSGDFEIIPGLYAEFKGTAHIFDSEAAQRQYGWTDEQRELVETHLLKHPDYGNGLYLAPGETLNAKQRKLVGEKTPVDRPCAFIWTEDYQVKQCPETAIPGTEHCEQHSREVVKITPGMSTTAGKV